MDVLRLLRMVEGRMALAGRGKGDGVGLAGLHGLEEVFDEVSLLVAAQHEGDARDLGDLLAFQLGVAARHDHDGARILPHHLVDLLATFMVRHLRHRTSVDQADVCSFARVRLADTHII